MDAIVNFAAYSYAPLSVVSPISGCVIIFNAGLANRIFGERLGLRDLIGSVLILLCGSVAVVTGSRQVCRVFSSPSCDDESSNVCFLPCSRRRLIAPPRSSRRDRGAVGAHTVRHLRLDPSGSALRPVCGFASIQG